MAVWDDAYTDEPTYVRIFTDGMEWFIDGVDNEGNYTESCWSFDSHEEAAANVEDFVKIATEDWGVTWKWRQPRHDQS
jgi:hypothetical protein